jgi:hypothetical protein
MKFADFSLFLLLVMIELSLIIGLISSKESQISLFKYDKVMLFGEPKSGTSWLTNTIKQLVSMFCPVFSAYGSSMISSGPESPPLSTVRPISCRILGKLNRPAIDYHLEYFEDVDHPEMNTKEHVNHSFPPVLHKIRFTEASKHLIPFVFQDLLSCHRENGLTDIFPCNMNLGKVGQNGSDVNWNTTDIGEQLKNCVSDCYTSQSLIGGLESYVNGEIVEKDIASSSFSHLRSQSLSMFPLHLTFLHILRDPR